MRAVLIYEPACAATRLVAQAVAVGLDRSVSVIVLSPSRVDASLLINADLVVIGGPAQVARATASPQVREYEVGSPDSPIQAPNILNWQGVREWLGWFGQTAKSAAVFDTRVRGRAVFARRAAKAVARDLAQHGMPVIVPPASFLIEETGRPAPNETRRAEAWGANLGGVVGTRRAAG